MCELKKLQSKKWDCIFTLEELIKFNEGNCLLNINYSRHKYDECYGGYLMYLKNPNKNNEREVLEIGITEDGFVYVGDTYINDYFLNNITTKVLKFETACKIMMSFRDVLKSVDEYERNIIKLIDNDRVNIVHRYDYCLTNNDEKYYNTKYKDEVI